MRKASVKRLLGIVLSAAMACTLVPSLGGSTGSKVEAASSGTWTLTKTDSYRPSDFTHGDRSCSFAEPVVLPNGNVQLSVTRNYSSGSESTHIKTVSECTAPKNSYADGEKASVTETLTVSEYSATDNAGSEQGRIHVRVDEDGLTAFTGSPAYGYFEDSSGHAYVERMGYSEGTGTSTMTAYYTFPSSAKNGDVCAIYFVDGTGYLTTGEVKDSFTYYKWVYKYSTGGSASTTTTTTTNSDTEDEATEIGDSADDEELDQVTGVKLTNKKVKRIYIKFDKVSNADGYEIVYSTNSSLKSPKKLVTKKIKGYFLNKKGKKTAFKKGKTYYVKVRAYKKDSDGTKIYGDWSTVKSVKIKK